MIRVHRRDWRGLWASVPHYGPVSLATWLEVFNFRDVVIWSSGPDRWSRDARLVLERESLLSCRLVGQSVDVLDPELELVLRNLRQREVRYRHYRNQVMAGAFGDLDHGHVGQGARPGSHGCECLRVDVQRIHEGFVRAEIALGFMQCDEVVKGKGGHAEDCV